MPVNVPDNPKVYTTTYDSFRGVDFTNDATNVWRRRSPTGLNMLPDDAGRPFKRHGWEILLSQEDLLGALSMFDYAEAEDIDEDTFNAEKTKYYTESGGVYTQCNEEDEFDPEETYYIRTFPSSVAIQKCAYFELAGQDHIVIFTTAGVIFYNSDGFTAVETDTDCSNAYDRCFFFEGNGTSAFYIYANFKVWRYSYKATGFVLELLKDKDLTVPTVIVSAGADGTGTMLQGFNLLGTLARVEYNSIALKTSWYSGDIEVSVPNTFPSAEGIYAWNYTTQWDNTIGSTSLSTAGITVSGTPVDGNGINVVNKKGVLLPNNVTDVTKVEVHVSKSQQFDTKLTVKDSGTPAASECTLHQDTVAGKRAWIEFGQDWSTVNNWGATGMDFVRVTFPTNVVKETPFDDPDDTDLQYQGSATLIVEGV